MKAIKKVIILISIFCIIGCSKDESPIAAPTPVAFRDEMPIPTFYANAGFNNVASLLGQPPFEVGLTFKPLEYGVIKAITIKLPAFNRNRITLWDKATGTALLTWRVPILSSDVVNGMEYVVPLDTPFALTKNKEYILSMNADNFYMRSNGGPDRPYPYNVGSVQILNYIESPTGLAQVMPSIIFGNYVTGDLGFKFQRI